MKKSVVTSLARSQARSWRRGLFCRMWIGNGSVPRPQICPSLAPVGPGAAARCHTPCVCRNPMLLPVHGGCGGPRTRDRLQPDDQLLASPLYLVQPLFVLHLSQACDSTVFALMLSQGCYSCVSCLRLATGPSVNQTERGREFTVLQFCYGAVTV